MDLVLYVLSCRIVITLSNHMAAALSQIFHMFMRVNINIQSKDRFMILKKIIYVPDKGCNAEQVHTSIFVSKQKKNKNK